MVKRGGEIEDLVEVEQCGRGRDPQERLKRRQPSPRAREEMVNNNSIYSISS